MEDNLITIELFPMIFDEKKFDFKIFYQDVLRFSEEDLNSGFQDGKYKIESLEYQLKKKEVVQKTTLKTELSLSKNKKIGIKAYSLVKKLRCQPSIPVEKNTGQILKRVIKNSIDGEKYIVNEEHIGKYLDSADKKIPFEENDIKKVKNFLKEGFLILGFKKRSSLKKYFNKRSSIFITADDNQVEHSSEAFDALIK